MIIIQVTRYTQTHLGGVPFSAQSALDRMKAIKAGELLLNENKTPIITNLTEEQKDIYRQPKL